MTLEHQQTKSPANKHAQCSSPKHKNLNSISTVCLQQGIGPGAIHPDQCVYTSTLFPSLYVSPSLTKRLNVVLDFALAWSGKKNNTILKSGPLSFELTVLLVYLPLIGKCHVVSFIHFTSVDLCQSRQSLVTTLSPGTDDESDSSKLKTRKARL